MRLRSLISVAALAAAASLGGQVQAATALTVNVTLTIDATIDVNWCLTSGAGDDATAQAWVLGASIPLNTAHQSTGTGADGTAPVARFIENNSNATVDIAVVCGNSTNWNVGPTAAANVFMMQAKIDAGGTYVSIDTSVNDWINNLAHHAASTVRSGEVFLQLTTPSSITVGGGRQQTIVVTFTASADSGD